jgi:predicted nucleic acid-binding protein
MIVVDASVWVSMLVPQDANHEISRRWLMAQTEAAQRLIEPVLMLTEVAGAIARRTGSSEIARNAIDAVMQMPLLHIVTIDNRLGQEATSLAVNLHLRGADAIYVAVARQLGVPLASWDQEQLERARPVVNISQIK